MAFDGMVMAAVTQALQVLVGERVEKIHQPNQNNVILVVHSRQQGRIRLILSADAQDARVHMTGETYSNPLTPPTFCMVLRKHLEGGRILSIAQSGLERVLQLAIESRDELGRLSQKLLICEVMGKHSNIILVDPSANLILDGIHRYSHGVSRYREVLPGRVYLPPPEQAKVDPRTIAEEVFQKLLLSASLETKITDIILQNFHGFGPLTCREIVFRAGLALDYPLDQCGNYELQRLWQAFQSTVGMLKEGHFSPTLLLDRNKIPLEFAVQDLTHYPAKYREQADINEVLDRYYASRYLVRSLNQVRGNLMQVVRKEQNRLHKKVSLYRQSLGEGKQADQFKLYGELLTANLYRLGQGEGTAVVENFYDPNLSEISISLNPNLSPNENAQAYFKKYVKARNTVQAVSVYLNQAQDELAYLEMVETALNQAVDQNDLAEIRQELEEQGYLKPRSTPQKLRQNKKDRIISRPLAFRSTEGWLILVGKNNKQNDYLTLRLAQDEDIWLHTKNIPGAHVIIRTAGKPAIPDQTMLEAATLAAYFSKARQAGNVPVDYTRRKHVHKPRGAKPGMVIYEHQHTISVTPREALVEEIMERSVQNDA